MSDSLNIKEVLQMMVERYKMENHMQAENIKTTWEEVVGPYVSKYTEKLVVKDHVLYVKFKAAELRTEMQYAKTQLIKNLNYKIGSEYLKDIKFY